MQGRRPARGGRALEALSLAGEARTAAQLEAGVPGRRSGLPASGTGTGCIVERARG